MHGEDIHWKLRKRLKFDDTNECCMYKSEPVLENETHKILWDFVIQTRRQDLVLINQKKKELVI